jgi:xanthine dehydrogenase molybdenum-binding subunit
MDPTLVALKNDGYEGEGMDYVDAKKVEFGYPVIDSLKECIDVGKAAIGWDSKWHAPGEKTLEDGRKHGMAFTWDHEWNGKPQGGECGIMINHDGSASVLGSHADIGVNPATGICQVVAEEIGLSYDKVNCRLAEDQSFTFFPPACSGAFTTNIAAAKKAARSCKAQLLAVAATKMGVSADALNIKNDEIFEIANPSNKITVTEAVGE